MVKGNFWGVCQNDYNFTKGVQLNDYRGGSLRTPKRDYVCARPLMQVRQVHL